VADVPALLQHLERLPHKEAVTIQL
jgi:hypothetical protein